MYCSPSPQLTLVALTHLPQAVTRFVQLADDSDDVPDLRGKKYSDYRLSKSEWDKLVLMREVLQVKFANISHFSSHLMVHHH
jgi:hypothetical protein